MITKYYHEKLDDKYNALQELDEDSPNTRELGAVQYYQNTIILLNKCFTYLTAGCGAYGTTESMIFLNHLSCHASFICLYF